MTSMIMIVVEVCVYVGRYSVVCRDYVIMIVRGLCTGVRSAIRVREQDLPVLNVDLNFFAI